MGCIQEAYGGVCGGNEETSVFGEAEFGDRAFKEVGSAAGQEGRLIEVSRGGVDGGFQLIANHGIGGIADVVIGVCRGQEEAEAVFGQDGSGGHGDVAIGVELDVFNRRARIGGHADFVDAALGFKHIVVEGKAVYFESAPGCVHRDVPHGQKHNPPTQEEGRGGEGHTGECFAEGNFHEVSRLVCDGGQAKQGIFFGTGDNDEGIAFGVHGKLAEDKAWKGMSCIEDQLFALQAEGKQSAVFAERIGPAIAAVGAAIDGVADLGGGIAGEGVGAEVDFAVEIVFGIKMHQGESLLSDVFGAAQKGGGGAVDAADGDEVICSGDAGFGFKG